MKSKITLALFVLIGALSNLTAQSVTPQTYTFKCAEIDNSDETTFINNYLMNNYGEYVFSYTSDLNTKVAVVSANIQPIDLMQIYRHLGYEVFYINDGVKYFLTSSGTSIEESKIQD